MIYSVIMQKHFLEEDFDAFSNALQNEDKEEIRLDDFYVSLLFKDKKYSELWKVVQLALIFSHGSVSVESGFSVIKSLLSEN